jgi:hypothetical protein
LAWGCVLIIHFAVMAHENTNVVGRRVSADDSFIYLKDYVIQRRMNKQSGFNAEQIEKDNYPESKTV